MENVCTIFFLLIHIAVIVLHIKKPREDVFNYSKIALLIFCVLPLLLYSSAAFYVINISSGKSPIEFLLLVSKVSTFIGWPYLGFLMSKKKSKEGEAPFYFMWVVAAYLIITIGAYFNFNNIIEDYLKNKIGRNGWVYYISEVSSIRKSCIRSGYQYSIEFSSQEYGTDQFVFNTDHSDANTYEKGDKALWRKGYKEDARFKVSDNYWQNDIAKRVERYHTPVLVIDHKGIHLNNVTAPSQYGVNILYKAKMVPLNYDTVYLDFKDIHNMDRRVAYNVSKIWPQIPDTFLLFNNEVNAPDFVVCAKQINTPENWKMISDYGYIFDYDIFSKEEIEDRFPEVKKYAEELKLKK